MGCSKLVIPITPRTLLKTDKNLFKKVTVNESDDKSKIRDESVLLMEESGVEPDKKHEDSKPGDVIPQTSDQQTDLVSNDTIVLDETRESETDRNVVEDLGEELLKLVGDAGADESNVPDHDSLDSQPEQSIIEDDDDIIVIDDDNDELEIVEEVMAKQKHARKPMTTSNIQVINKLRLRQ